MVVPTEGSELVKTVRDLRGPLHVCVEEGEWGEWISEILTPWVARVVVCRPQARRGPKSDAVDARELYGVLHTEAGLNAVINLNVEGSEVTTLAREVQRDPVRGDIIHLDFIRISLTETVAAEVSVEYEGVPIGVRDDGGIVETIRATVNIEALATDIPPSITIDINDMTIGDVLRVADLPRLEGVTYLDDEEAGLVTVSVPAAVIAEEAAEEEELLEVEEGEEVEEGVAEPGEEGAESDSSQAEAEKRS